MRGFVKE